MKHTESLNGWEFSYNITVSTKFKGTYVEVMPVGKLHLRFQKSNNYYTWDFVNSYVNGLLLGKVLISQQGEVGIINHTKREVCNLKFHQAPAYFSKETPHRVTAIVRDSQEFARYILDGVYVEKVECSSIVQPQKIKTFEEIKSLELSQRKILWRRNFLE
jgi:hypothetical protein